MIGRILLAGWIILVLALALLLAGSVNAQPNNLFTVVNRADVDLSDTQSKVLDDLESEPTTKRVTLIRIDLNLPKTADRMNLALSDEESIELETTGMTERTPEDFTWFGSNPDIAGDAVLVVQQGDMVGTIRTGGKLFRVRPVGEDLHALIEVDETRFPPEHPPDFDRPPASETADLGDPNLLATCPTETVIVAYTPGAAAQAGNINALIQLAIDETNQAYGNSQVDPRLQMVHRYQTSYTEADMSTDLTRFRTNGDGFMDEVHGLRDTHGADLAILITQSGGFCGIASAILANATTAFAVVGQNCATGYYSFGHELGHLQGARHNPEVDPTNAPFAYGHGFFHEPGNWRTVMSYNCPAGCTRLKYFSNPNVMFGGVAMGTVATHHNARVLNETSCTVAGFRPDATVGTPRSMFLIMAVMVLLAIAFSILFGWRRLPAGA